MKGKEIVAFGLVFAALLPFGGCGSAEGDRAAEAPPPAQVERAQDANVIQVDHPEQFPLSTAVAHQARSALVVTGVVTPDVSRNVPVITLGLRTRGGHSCAPGGHGAKRPGVADRSQR